MFHYSDYVHINKPNRVTFNYLVASLEYDSESMKLQSGRTILLTDDTKNTRGKVKPCVKLPQVISKPTVNSQVISKPNVYPQQKALYGTFDVDSYMYTLESKLQHCLATRPVPPPHMIRYVRN